MSHTIMKINFEGYQLLVGKPARRCHQRKMALVRLCKKWDVLKILNLFYHSLGGSASKRRSVFWVIYPRPSSCGITPVQSEVKNFSSRWRARLCSDYISLGYTPNIHNGPYSWLIIWKAKFGDDKLVVWLKTINFWRTMETKKSDRLF